MRILLGVSLLLSFWAVPIAMGQKSADTIKLSSTDKRNIMIRVLDHGFKKLMEDETFSQCTVPIVGEEKVILVETPEGRIWPKALGEYRFRFLTDKELESEIKSNDGDCFFRFSGFLAVNRKSVRLTLWRWIEVVTNYPGRWVAATGLKYRAVKSGRVWIVRFENEVWATN